MNTFKDTLEDYHSYDTDSETIAKKRTYVYPYLGKCCILTQPAHRHHVELMTMQVEGMISPVHNTWNG